GMACIGGPLTRQVAPRVVVMLGLGVVLVQRLGRLAPDDVAVPLRVLALLTLAIGEPLGRGETDGGHRRAAGREPHFGVTTEVADENCLVDAAHVPADS